MVELHSWLPHQHPGLKTYVALQQKTNELAQSDAEHRAVYKLLSSILDPFIASFDEEPLPAGVAEATFQRLLAVRPDFERGDVQYDTGISRLQSNIVIIDVGPSSMQRHPQQITVKASCGFFLACRHGKLHMIDRKEWRISHS